MSADRRAGIERRSVPRQTEDRRRGRPRLDRDPLTSVGTRVPTHVYDRLVQVASRREMSVSAFMRRVLIISLSR